LFNVPRRVSSLCSETDEVHKRMFVFELTVPKSA
jgi:hypothetical protein